MRGFIAGVALLFAATTANAQEVAAAGGQKMGLSAGLKLSYGSPNKAYDKDGKSANLMENDVGIKYTFMLINLGVGYDLAAVAPGLYAGLDLPIVMNKASIKLGALGSGDASGSGLGDVSLHAGYLVSASDKLKIGPQLRFKAATGKSPYDITDEKKMPTGSGHNNIQVSAIVKGDMAPIALDAEVGYLMSMGKTVESVKVNPGDAIYATLGVGYAVNEMITPRLGVYYGNVGKDKVEDTADDESGSQWLGLALDVNLKINDMISASLGTTTSLEGISGMNLPYGFVVMGKNTLGGILGFNAGVTGSF